MTADLRSFSHICNAGESRWIRCGGNSAGGRLKSFPSDFIVEEQFDPKTATSGNHTHLWIEKHGLNTLDVVQQIAELFDLQPKEVGYCGLKDYFAITRQWISVPQHADIGRLNQEQTATKLNSWRTLHTTFENQKLRIGHSQGNHFKIKIREINPDFKESDLHQILDTLSNQGYPNFFGPQRFGDGGFNLTSGINLLRAMSKKSHRPRQQKLLLSAVQSAVFNAYLVQRLGEQTELTILEGDLINDEFGLQRWMTVLDDSQNPDELRLQLTGPMWGSKMRAARSDPGTWERAALQAFEIDPKMFLSVEKILPGTRRPLIAMPRNLQGELDKDERTINLNFTLPSGSYATVLCAQIMN